MMVSIRISLANLAVAQTRKLQVLLESLSRSPREGMDLDRIRKEAISQADSLAALLLSRRHFVEKTSGGYQLDPRFLLFEFCEGILLRDSQVALVKKLLAHMQAGQSICHQMIMGAGKTTVVSPLLAMLLSSADTLVVQVVPPALLTFSAGILRERFGSAIRKPVFTFSFERHMQVTPQVLVKLRAARTLRAVLVSSPSSIKSFTLKFIEICHILNRHKHISAEQKQRAEVDWALRLRHLLGLGDGSSDSVRKLTPEEVEGLKRQADICVEVFSIFKRSVEIMDEVDVLLHPLKSELNWPLGHKEPLDFTRSRIEKGIRWNIPSHLLDAVFSACGMPVLADVSDSRVASESLPLSAVVLTLCS
jgi:hypothetical protein